MGCGASKNYKASPSAESSSETAPTTQPATQTATQPVKQESPPEPVKSEPSQQSTEAESAEAPSTQVKSEETQQKVEAKSLEEEINQRKAAPEGAEAAPEGAEAAPESAEAAPKSAEAAPDSAEAAPDSAEAAPDSAKAAPESAEEPSTQVTESVELKKKPAAPQSHSAIRWGKPVAELEGIVDDVECEDPGNGNRPIHLAAQNGHLEIVKWLISKKCNVDAQNGTGATALHMATAYDFYFVVEALLAAGADITMKNEAGNESIKGLDGDKTGSDAWDSGMNMLLSANSAAMAETALSKIEANPEGVDKAKFAQIGMKKKKDIDGFPKEKFTELMKSL